MTRTSGFRRAAVALAALAVVVPLSFLSLRSLRACGPFLPDPVFVFTQHPDLPLDGFAAGRIGIVQPTWAPSYLVVAYRALSGRPLSRAEQASALALWNARRKGGWMTAADSALADWLAARRLVLGPDARSPYPPQDAVGRFQRMSDEGRPAGVTADAYRSAAAHLRALAGAHGATSGDVREWLAAQDAVFGDGPEPALLEGHHAAWLVADRAYQRAAWRLYHGPVDATVESFHALAADPHSPYRALARYLVARALVEGAWRQTAHGVVADTAVALEAEQVIARRLADPAFRRYHPALRALRGRLRYHVWPDRRRRELAAALSRDDGAAFGQDLADYTWLLDALVRRVRATIPEESLRVAGQLFESPESGRFDARWLPEALRGEDDLTAWVLNVQETGTVAPILAEARGQESPGMPWLVARLLHWPTRWPGVAQYLREPAERGPGLAAATPSLAYHRARLLAGRGDATGARAALDRLLARQAPRLPRSARNQALDLRRAVASDLDDFAAHLIETPTGWRYDLDYDGPTPPEDHAPPVELSVDAGRTLSLDLPVDSLAQLVESDALPRVTRGRLALATWVRAALLGRVDVALQLVPAVRRAEPALAGDLAAWERAPDTVARRGALLYLLLRSPGARPFVGWGVNRLVPVDRIDDYRDNWWCRADLGMAPSRDPEGWGRESGSRYGPSGGYPGFGLWQPAPEPVQGRAYPPAAARAQAAHERARLAAQGSAAVFLPRAAVAWARAHPRDPRAPEMLCRAVRVTRYACFAPGEPVSTASREAFQLLHARYPSTEWARRTTYWY